MFRFIIAIIIMLHGLIHIMGFAKAFGFGHISQLTKEISKPMGVLWFSVAGLFLISAIQVIFKNDKWWILAVLAILISQFLIFSSWQDAKFGTVANIIILVAAIIGYGSWSFNNKYRNEVKHFVQMAVPNSDSLLTENDLLTLPDPVKKYLYYTGAVNKPRVKNFKIEFKGQIRKDTNSEWMPFSSEQFNFMDASARLFLMKATMKHLPVTGFHSFINGNAFMDIRLFSLFKVQYQSGPEMGIAETVTFFNDMCCMAPATLIDKRIKWLETTGNKVHAEFTNNNITISAWLHFNDKGELENFISEDRYAVAENNTMKRIPWSTPARNYKEFNGIKLASDVDAVYHYPDGELCYGNFRLVNVIYNCREIK